MARIPSKYILKRNYLCAIWRLAVLLAIPSALHSQSSIAQAIAPPGQPEQHAPSSPVAAAGSSSIGIAPEGIARLKLMPGSMISVHVYEEPDLDGGYRLDDKGNIVIPAAGTIPVGSLTLHEAEAAISGKLIQGGILKRAHVIVNLVDYTASYISVSGEVGAPGRFPVMAPRNLGDVLAMAGGASTTAGSEIVITRGGQTTQPPIILPYKRNQGNSQIMSTVVNPGDSVFVKRAGIVYVFGAVVRPGGYLMQDDGTLTLAGAISQAYGTSPEAAISRVRLLRKAPDKSSWITINVPLNKIQKGKMAPPELQAGDIVYVPPSVLKEAAINVKGLVGGVGNAIVYTVR